MRGRSGASRTMFHVKHLALTRPSRVRGVFVRCVVVSLDRLRATSRGLNRRQAQGSRRRTLRVMGPSLSTRPRMTGASVTGHLAGVHVISQPDDATARTFAFYTLGSTGSPQRWEKPGHYWVDVSRETSGGEAVPRGEHLCADWGSGDSTAKVGLFVGWPLRRAQGSSRRTPSGSTDRVV